MKPRRVGSTTALWAMLFAVALAGCAPSGPYPQKTVTIICPWAAGGGTDTMSRYMAGALEEQLGGSFVVVNKTGGSGAVGHEAGAQARPDGYTITMITVELNTMHHMDISPVTWRDYEPVAQLNADAAAIIVDSDADWSTLTDFLDEIKARPGEIKMSGTSAGGIWDLARAGLLDAYGLSAEDVIWVPTEGAKPSLIELLGGHLDAVCCSVPEAAPQIEAGELKVLAVMSDERLAEYPQIPTAREAGVAWTAVGWRGLAVPKGTPAAIVDQLAAACERIAASDDFRSFMQKSGFAAEHRGPEEFRTFLARQDEQWKPVVQAAGFRSIGPYAYPAALAVFLAVGMVAVAVGAFIQGSGTKGMARWGMKFQIAAARLRRRGNLNALLIVLGLPLYLAAMHLAGFALPTFVFATLLMWRLKVPLWLSAIVSAGLIVAVWLLFAWLFEVQLPTGLLGMPY